MAKILEKSALKKRAETLLNIKNSPHYTTLELFVQDLYGKIVDVQSAKIINLIEQYRNIA